jgi:putative ABC transport system permease protein
MPDWKEYVLQHLAKSGLPVVRVAAIVEELAQHMEEAYAEALAEGLSEAEAYACAEAEFPQWQGMAKEMAEIERRAAARVLEQWEAASGWRRMMSGWLQDVRYGLRMLGKRAAFTALAVLTLALGIGANTAIFSVVYGVLLKPLPFPEPERLVTLWQNDTRNHVERDDLSPPNLVDWQEQSKSFEALAALNPWSHDYTSGDEPATFRSALVTEGFFEILGVKPLVGRTFLPEEYTAGRHRVAVLRYGTWKQKFGGDPGIVGTKILLDKEPYTVVGVMPEEFRIRMFGPRERELYAPQVVDEEWRTEGRSATYLRVLGRLKPGVTLREARTEVAGIAARLAQEYPRENTGVSATVLPYHEYLVSDARTGLLVLWGAVGFVLLIACANVANLLLARGNERLREMAIRTALGAGRARLVRQLLTESALLGVAGAAGGVLLAQWGVEAIVKLSPGNLPRLDEVVLDGTVLAFAAGAALLTVLLFGLLPAIHLARTDLQPSLREGSAGAGTGSGRQRFRGALVISELALALVLLAGAGLLLRSFTGLLRVNPGFDAEKILSLQVFIWSSYPKPEQRAAFVRDALARFEALPGVEAAAATTTLPFFPSSQTTMLGVTVEGQPAPPAGQERTALNSVATPGYFRTMGMPLVRGRTFTEGDTLDAPRVVVINETLARQFFGGDDPVGRRITVQLRQPLSAEVVGVVADVKHARLDEPSKPEFWRANAQIPMGSVIFAIRGQNPASLVQSAKAALWEVDKVPIYYLSTLDELLGRSLEQRRFTMLLLGSFAVLAMTLAAVGIYGVISYSTAQRTHEIGVRMALGAQPRDILRMVLRQGMRMAGAGIALGVALALVLTRLLSTMLFDVRASDPLTLGGVTVLLAAVALLACWLPARRATRVDPLHALRYE